MLLAVQRQQAIDDVVDPVHRHFRHDLTEVREPLVRAAAADEHEILGHLTRPELAYAALEADGGDVMLATPVGAAADLDVPGGDEIDELGVGAEMFDQGAAEPA